MWNKELESGDAIVFNYPAEGFLGAMRAQSSKLKPIHHSFFEKCQNKEWESGDAIVSRIRLKVFPCYQAATVEIQKPFTIDHSLFTTDNSQPHP